MLTSPGYLSHSLGIIVVETEAEGGVSVLQQYLSCCLGVAGPATYQYNTLWRCPGAVISSPTLGQGVGLLPVDTATGEGDT